MLVTVVGDCMDPVRVIAEPLGQTLDARELGICASLQSELGPRWEPPIAAYETDQRLD